MKKLLIVGALCLAVFGVSVPVFASNLQGDVKDEVQGTASSLLEDTVMEAVNAAVEARMGCGHYVDANGDGLCDHCVAQRNPLGLNKACPRCLRLSRVSALVPSYKPNSYLCL